MRIDRTIDVKDLSCPMVVMRAKKIIGELPAGARVEVLATDPMSENDIRQYCETDGHDLADTAVVNGIFRFLIVVKEQA